MKAKEAVVDGIIVQGCEQGGKWLATSQFHIFSRFNTVNYFRKSSKNNITMH
jgi:hypothetical protein